MLTSGLGDDAADVVKPHATYFSLEADTASGEVLEDRVREPRRAEEVVVMALRHVLGRLEVRAGGVLGEGVGVGIGKGSKEKGKGREKETAKGGLKEKDARKRREKERKRREGSKAAHVRQEIVVSPNMSSTERPSGAATPCRMCFAKLWDMCEELQVAEPSSIVRPAEFGLLR